MDYEPKPIDTSKITLDEEILELTEKLAASTHDVWATKRFSDGWRYGPTRDDAKKQHPGLVPYDELTDQEKEYDRATALETLKAILALGYEIKRAPTPRKASGKKATSKDEK
jgi:hypothetical protein